MPRISVDMLALASQFTNALKDREIDLRGQQIAVIENMGPTLVRCRAVPAGPPAAASQRRRLCFAGWRGSLPAPAPRMRSTPVDRQPKRWPCAAALRRARACPHGARCGARRARTRVARVAHGRRGSLRGALPKVCRARVGGAPARAE